MCSLIVVIPLFSLFSSEMCMALLYADRPPAAAAVSIARQRSSDWYSERAKIAPSASNQITVASVDHCEGRRLLLDKANKSFATIIIRSNLSALADLFQ